VKEPQTPREHALAFIAAYDRPDADEYERHVVRIARTWLSIMKPRKSVQGIVDRIIEEFDSDASASYGCGWDELKRQFINWAVKEEWLKPSEATATPPT
jgi:hypothetical protein